MQQVFHSIRKKKSTSSQLKLCFKEKEHICVSYMQCKLSLIPLGFVFAWCGHWRWSESFLCWVLPSPWVCPLTATLVQRFVLGFLHVALVSTKPWTTFPCSWPPWPQVLSWGLGCEILIQTAAEGVGRCIHEEIQPWQQQEAVWRSSTWAPILWGSEDTLWSSPSPPLGITDLFGRWRNCLQRSCTLSGRTLWRLPPPAIQPEPRTLASLQGEAAEPQGLGADVWTTEPAPGCTSGCEPLLSHFCPSHPIIWHPPSKQKKSHSLIRCCIKSL